jgi:CheY-like chemotaxis protein
MKIFVVDDEKPLVDLVGGFLDRLNHTHREFTDPREALRAIDHTVDLVIADVSMPQLDGFRLALRVAAVLGMSPPRTLLISGNDQAEQLKWASPSMVIGVLPKPFTCADLQSVLEVLQQTRSRCPGVLMPICPCGVNGVSSRLSKRRPCDNSDYASCRFYGTACGKSLQQWIGDRRWDLSPT